MRLSRWSIEEGHTRTKPHPVDAALPDVSCASDLAQGAGHGVDDITQGVQTLGVIAFEASV